MPDKWMPFLPVPDLSAVAIPLRIIVTSFDETMEWAESHFGCSMTDLHIVRHRHVALLAPKPDA